MPFHTQTSATAPTSRLGGAGLDFITSSTFSAASSVSVDGCFTASYENYKILLNLDSASVTSSATFRLRGSGADAATNYNVFGWIATSGALSNNSGTGNTFIATATTTTTDGSYSVMEIGRPALAVQTHVYVQQYNSNTPAAVVGIGAHTVTTAYDGFSLIASAGNITGRVRVYGYRSA